MESKVMGGGANINGNVAEISTLGKSLYSSTIQHPTSSTNGTTKTPSFVPKRERTNSLQKMHDISSRVSQKPKSSPRRWSIAEDEALRAAVKRSGERNWKSIAQHVSGRNHTQCLQRWTKVLKPGLVKGHWTPAEDELLKSLISNDAEKNWGLIAGQIEGRTSKQCRERWCNHLDPSINKGEYTAEEDKIILEMQKELGNKWSLITQHLNGRTEDAVKIRWKSLMRIQRSCDSNHPHALMKKKAKSPVRSPYSGRGGTASSASSSPARSRLSKAKTPTGLPKPDLSASSNSPSLSSSTTVQLSQISPERPSWNVKTATAAKIKVPNAESVLVARPITAPELLAPSSTLGDLSTPKEEWGSSTDSPMDAHRRVNNARVVETTPEATSASIISSSSASTVASPSTLRQQRYRLKIMERKKGQFMANPAVSVASPGQALLNEQLKEANQRQRRNSILEDGWKVAAAKAGSSKYSKAAATREAPAGSFDGYIQSMVPDTPAGDFLGADGKIILQSENSSRQGTNLI